MQDDTTNKAGPVKHVAPLSPRPSGLEDLRDRAQRKLREEVVRLQRDFGQDNASLLHELEVHQIELLVQNEELRLAQSELEKSRDRYSDLFDLAPVGYFAVSEKNLILEVNLTAGEMLGVPRGSLIGQRFERYVSVDDGDRFYLHQRQARKEVLRCVTELRMCREGGEEFQAQLTTVATKHDAGQLRIAVSDITERRKNEEALRESEERYKNLFENAREAILLIGLRGNITAVNRRVEDYGFKREKLIGQKLFDFVVEDYRARARADFQVLLGGKPVKGEMDVITPKGVFSVEYKDNPIRRGGRIVGIQAILTDVTKRKRAEQLLREERDAAQRYLDIAGVMLVVIDCEERVGLINKKGCEILGCTEEDVLGKNWFDHFLPPRIRERARAIFDGLMAGQTDENEYVEEVVLTQDGRERVMGWHNTLLKDETGRIIATLSSGEDITARRWAEEAHRSLVDHSLQGLAIFQDGRVSFVNQAMAEITGYAIDEMLAMPAEQVRDFVHPEDREMVWQNYRRRLAGEPVPEHYEMRGIRKDGLVCWLDIHASRIDYRGQPAVQAAYIDITERKRAEEALRESETRFRRLFERTPVAYQSLDTDGRLVDVNETWLTKMGYLHEEVIGRWFGDFVIPDQRELCREQFPRFKALGQVSGVEFEMLRKDGTTFIASFEGRIGRDEEGDFKQTHCIFLDVTERKRFEEALQQSERLYRSLFENMMNGFAYCRMLFDQGRPQDFIYLSVNEAFETQTGLKDVVGKRVSEVIPGIRESDPELFAIYGRVALTGLPEAFETYVSALKMWLSISVYSPQKEYFVALFDVITERKRVEEEVRQQLDELRRWHDVTIRREERIAELKREVNALAARLGEPPPYQSEDEPCPGEGRLR